MKKKTIQTKSNKNEKPLKIDKPQKRKNIEESEAEIKSEEQKNIIIQDAPNNITEVKPIKLGVKDNKTQGTLELFNFKKTNTTETKTVTKPLEPGTQITIYCWNINGLRAVLNKGVIEKFLKEENPDFFCLNETKIDDASIKQSKLNQLYNDQYASYWNCHKKKAGYSGVAIFTKYQPLSVTYGIGVEEHDVEGRVITLEYTDFYLIAVYVPNAGEGLKRLDYRIKNWDIAFSDYLVNLSKKKDIVLTGDLNVAHKDIDICNPKGNLKTPGFTIEERNSFSKFLDKGFTDTFRHLYPETVKYSFFSNRFGRSNYVNDKGWRLDYFVVNSPSIGKVVDSEILKQYEGSDHVPIKLTYKTNN